MTAPPLPPVPAAGAEPSAVVLDRLLALHPRVIDLSLGRILRLLRRLGNPHRRLPPVIHVAGTNGKGSVVAMLRSIVAAHGQSSHVYTSPHLVRFHERIVIAGRRIDDPTLVALLTECETRNAGEPITFFEITTAAAFLAFANTPADVVLLETGLGGRLDATNAVERPVVTAITPVDLDHQDFLGTTLAAIAGEKAGILKPGVPCVLARQAPDADRAIRTRAAALAAPVISQGRDWHIAAEGAGLWFRGLDQEFRLPLPGLTGSFQIQNAGQAVALAARWLGEEFDPAAAGRGIASARWPARLQRLDAGPLVRRLPPGWELWLDGGHNPAAGRALAKALAGMNQGLPTVLISAMMANKDASGFLAPLAGRIDRMVAVPVPGTGSGMAPVDLALIATGLGVPVWLADDVTGALEALIHKQAAPARVLIAGSLYLAGDVLRRSEIAP